MTELTSKPPFVSVIVVSYNYAKFLGRALEACRRQSFKDFELVIVDNGSTDNTDEVIIPGWRYYFSSQLSFNNLGLLEFPPSPHCQYWPDEKFIRQCC